MAKVLAHLASPGRALLFGLLISLAVSALAGNDVALVTAAFTLIQVGVVAIVASLFLIVIGLLARGLTQ